MKDHETQQRFIDLRSQGWSFSRIAAELNVSKSTLINWSRKFQSELQNLRAVELEALREKLIDTTEKRTQELANQLRMVEFELQMRDLSKVSTTRLYSIAHSLRREILQATANSGFTFPPNQIPKDEADQPVPTRSDQP